MEKKIVFQRSIKMLCLILCVVMLSSLAQDFCRYYDYNVERMAGFYAEPKDSLDVVLVGASEVFTGFSSGYAYDLYGFTSYPYAEDSLPGVLFESQVKEILKHQDPKWIVIDINGILYDDPSVHTDGANLRKFLNNIPYSWNRIRTMMELVPCEEWYFYLFPLAKNHSNWKEAANQWESILDYYEIKRNGAILKGNVTNLNVLSNMTARDVSEVDSCKPLESESERILRDFLDFCRKNEIKNVMFVRFPHFIAQDWTYDRFQRGNEAKRIITEEYGIPFVDLELQAEQMGLDYYTDFYNEDHLNFEGQQKLTEYFGRILVEQYGVEESVLTEKQRQDWDRAAEYTQLFYRYCLLCRETGGVIDLDESRWLIQELDALKAAG